ncbi:MAG: hypothetical protein ACJ76V_10745 [Thermoleophilaceae bacterium]
MSGISDAHHFRKMVAGACMLVAPLLFLAASIVSPEQSMNAAKQYAAIASNLDRWYVMSLMLLIGLVLVVPVVLGLMHMLREREVAYGHVGGGLAMLGVLALTGVVAIVGFAGWQIAQPGRPQLQMINLFHDLTHSAGIVIPFLVVSLGFGLGMAVLAIGLYRARAVQSWMAAALALGGLAVDVSLLVPGRGLSIASSAILAVALVSIGRMVIEETDADWEHTPEYKDFRPLAGMR